MDGFTRIIKGGFYLKPKGIGSEIAQSAPLIMTGFFGCICFKTGLFNIGAAGQYTVGVFGALYFCHHPPHAMVCMPSGCCGPWSHLGSSSGIFKAYFNVNGYYFHHVQLIGLYLVNES